MERLRIFTLSGHPAEQSLKTLFVRNAISRRLCLTYHNHRLFPQKSPYPAGINRVPCLSGSHSPTTFSGYIVLPRFISLFIYLTITVDRNLQPFGKCIYNRCAYTVQTTGYLVSAAAELTARMQDRKYDFNRRNTCLFLDVNRNATSVILYCYELSALICTSMWLQYPASASSTELSTISYTR